MSKIGQNTKAIALVFSILECISEWNEIAQSSSARKGEFSVAILSHLDQLVGANNWPHLNQPAHQEYSLGVVDFRVRLRMELSSNNWRQI